MEIFSSWMIRTERMRGGGWGPEMTAINSGLMQKSSLQRYAWFLPNDGHRNDFSLVSWSSSCTPLTLIVASLVSLQRMIHVMRAGRRRGAEQVEGLELRRTGIEPLSSSDHGAVRSLHFKELDDEGGAPRHDLGRQVAEGTVLDAHDGQLAAQGQLEREAVQVGVVVEVQLLQVLQGA